MKNNHDFQIPEITPVDMFICSYVITWLLGRRIQVKHFVFLCLYLSDFIFFVLQTNKIKSSHFKNVFFYSISTFKRKMPHIPCLFFHCKTKNKISACFLFLILASEHTQTGRKAWWVIVVSEIVFAAWNCLLDPSNPSNCWNLPLGRERKPGQWGGLWLQYHQRPQGHAGGDAMHTNKKTGPEVGCQTEQQSDPTK